jgi:hypothetical protein
MDDAVNNAADELDPRVERALQPGRGTPLITGFAQGTPIIDLALVSYDDLSPVCKLIYLILLLCLKDRASQLRSDPKPDPAPESPRFRLLYCVDGEYHDLVPPPDDFSTAMFRELSNLGNIPSFRSRLGQAFRNLAMRIDGRCWQCHTSTFQVQSDIEHVEIEVWATHTSLGEGLVLTLEPVPDRVSAVANQLMKRVFERP